MPEHDDFIALRQAYGASERANKDPFLIELCDAIGVPRPSPNKGDPERDVYVFERDAKMPHPGGVVTIGALVPEELGAGLDVDDRVGRCSLERSVVVDRLDNAVPNRRRLRTKIGSVHCEEVR